MNKEEVGREGSWNRARDETEHTIFNDRQQRASSGFLIKSNILENQTWKIQTFILLRKIDIKKSKKSVCYWNGFIDLSNVVYRKAYGWTLSASQYHN